MQHLKEADSERTVLMVQVENEAGTWGALRDYSAAAQRLFESPVPDDIRKAMGKSNVSGNWQQVFGAESDVCFHAWSVARYVGRVAAAGKAIYPLPLYANAALRDPLKPGAPGTYESGGPTDNVLPIWKVSAPALDVLAPDIYMNDSPEYLKVLELYHRADNPLFIPETGGLAKMARFFFSALGDGAIGYSPFGLDYTGGMFEDMFAEETGAHRDDSRNGFLMPTAENYRLIGPMMRQVAQLEFEGKLQAVAEETGKAEQTLHFGWWDGAISYGAFRNRAARGNPEPLGRALVAEMGENQFLVAGMYSRVDFHPVDLARHWQFLRVEEGVYRDGRFHFERILNGDQTDWGLNFNAEPVALHVTLSTY